MNLPPPLHFFAAATFSQRSRKGFSAMALVLVCLFVILLNRWPAGSRAAFRSAIRGDVILIDQHPSAKGSSTCHDRCFYSKFNSSPNHAVWCANIVRLYSSPEVSSKNRPACENGFGL